MPPRAFKARGGLFYMLPKIFYLKYLVFSNFKNLYCTIYLQKIRRVNYV